MVQYHVFFLYLHHEVAVTWSECRLSSEFPIISDDGYSLSILEHRTNQQAHMLVTVKSMRNQSLTMVKESLADSTYADQMKLQGRFFSLNLARFLHPSRFGISIELQLHARPPTYIHHHRRHLLQLRRLPYNLVHGLGEVLNIPRI